MLTLYQYLVQTLLPKQVEKEIQGGAVAAAQRHGRFISPPEGIRCEEDLLKIPKVYFMREDDTEAKQYYLVIYRTLSATVCFTVDGKFTRILNVGLISRAILRRCSKCYKVSKADDYSRSDFEICLKRS